MSDYDANGVAIIGMAGRFPGAPNLEAFWRNLRSGTESITFFERDRLAAGGVPEALLGDPSYVRARGILEGADLFDASFFGYSPREATIMDPQQRLFLECSWEALEGAGYDPRRFKGLVGVYGGATASSYQPLVYTDPATLAQSDPLSIAIGNDIAFLTTRVSYKLDLRGPSCPVQTACSTSLVAVHLACQGLLNAECDLALAGGASVRVPQENGYQYQPAGILSPDGHCRPFDAEAQGTLFSNGLGVVVLKRLDEALDDGDFVYAVIRGSAINNDGAHKASFTAPAVGGQSDVIADALMHAGVEPESISYIETHGTATSLGDSIEVQALNHAFPADRQQHYCALGSVKSNLGHLDAAAGMAALIKTVLALQHRELPPSLHYVRPNPDIGFTNSAFYVNAELREWKANDGLPLRAGVSAFGFGGTNAHVVLEEAPTSGPSGPSRPWQLLTLSAETDAGVGTAASNLADHLRANPHQPLADVAYTLKVGRRAFRHRRIVVCRDRESALEALDSRQSGRLLGGAADSGDRPVVFMFPGQGSQHVDMGRELYEQEPIVREAVDRCADILRGPLGLDLRDLLYPEDGASPDANDRLRRTRYAQPALFTIEYALAKLWMAWGVRPEACIGHSIGEFVAACLAGVMTLEDALRLVAVRGALMDEMPAGVMLAVPLPENRLQPLLGDRLWLSVVNAPSMCVVSGAADDVDGLEDRLTRQGIECQRLHTSHAFHSGLMDQAVEPFVAEVSKVELHPPSLPYLSNVTGTWIAAEQACDPAYWGRQLRQAVRFGDGVAELLKREQRVFLEVGPGQTLSSLVRQQGKGRVAPSMFSTLRHARRTQTGSDYATALETLGRLWLGGVEVAWSDFYRGESRRRVPLPTYPFQRQRYWVNPVGRSAPAASAREHHAGKIAAIDRWFYTPTWTRTPPASRPMEPGGDDRRAWLLLKDDTGLGEAVARTLHAAGQRVIEVDAGSAFERVDASRYTLDLGSAGDYRALVDQLPEDCDELMVLHLWSASARDGEASVAEAFATDRRRSFESLLRLAQALDAAAPSDVKIRIGLITRGAREVTGTELLSPGVATALGLCRVIPQENPELACRSLDLDQTASPASPESAAAEAEWILAEMTARDGQAIVAHRGGYRWVPDYQAVPLAAPAAPSRLLRSGGVYLITGGLGDIGLNIAEYLAGTVQARLVLTGRSPVLPPEEWSGYAASHGDGDPLARRIRRLRRIEAAGGEVLVVQADVSRPEDMERAFEAGEARFGPVHGIVHAAGLVVGDAFRPLGETDEDVCRRQFAPKIEGLCVLDTVMRRRAMAPDFVLLVSSLSSVLGGLRFAAYASANAFMDAFACWRRRTSPARWLTVNWDSWLRAGEEPRAGSADAPVDLVMTGAEGIEALHRLLAADLGVQVLVSTGDLHARVDQWIRLQAVADQDASAAAPAVRYPRPNLHTDYVAPTDELERTVAEIWQELLGIEQVGLNDSFFELGGDSLLGVQVIARIKKQLAVAVSAVSLYEGPTVGRLAALIRAGRSPEQLEQSRSRGDKRRAQKLRQLQVAG